MLSGAEQRQPGGALFRSADRDDVAIWLCRAVGGWLRCFTVPTGFRSLGEFVHRLTRFWLRILRRRSQQIRIAWNEVGLLARIFRPRLRIMYPRPNRRFASNTRGRSPVPWRRMGICSGKSSNRRSTRHTVSLRPARAERVSYGLESPTKRSSSDQAEYSEESDRPP